MKGIIVTVAVLALAVLVSGCTTPSIPDAIQNISNVPIDIPDIPNCTRQWQMW